MDDAIQTDLNLSSLSVSSPSVSSCSATLPFPVYYCKNSDLISVFARYVDPKWILFWLFWLDWRRQKKLKRDLFFSFFFFSHRIIRGKLLSCLQNHQDNSGLLNEWTKATICSLSKALSWWPKNIIIIIEWIHSSYTGWPSKFSYNYNNVNGKENPAKFSV